MFTARPACKIEAGVLVAPCFHDLGRQQARIGETGFVAAGHLYQSIEPEFFRQPRMPGMASRHGDVLGAVQIGLADRYVRRIGGQRNRILQRADRMRVECLIGHLSRLRVGIVDEGFPPNGKWKHDRPVSGSDFVEQRHIMRRLMSSMDSP